MNQQVQPVTLTLPFRLGKVNCYLVPATNGLGLIDTGASNGRRTLERELERAGCRPGDLKLIVLTHGDFDHTGNASYLRRKHGARIALHRDDAGMMERGDIFYNRRGRGPVFRTLAARLFGFGRQERCAPDLFIDEGDDLSEYGFNATVLHIPGHSRGSIAVLTADGALFCGDLLEFKGKPVLNSIIDDRAEALASFERLKGLPAHTVYPGHGPPFPGELLRRERG